MEHQAGNREQWTGRGSPTPRCTSDKHSCSRAAARLRSRRAWQGDSFNEAAAVAMLARLQGPHLELPEAGGHIRGRGQLQETAAGSCRLRGGAVEEGGEAGYAGTVLVDGAQHALHLLLPARGGAPAAARGPEGRRSFAQRWGGAHGRQTGAQIVSAVHGVSRSQQQQDRWHAQHAQQMCPGKRSDSLQGGRGQRCRKQRGGAGG